MARYIDADKFAKQFERALEHQQKYGLYNHAKITEYVIKAIENEPTADVVTKSEVERLEIELEVMRGAANSYKMHYEKAKAEVAREILDKVDNILWKYKRYGKSINVSHIYQDISELKNKYTEAK